METGNGNMDKIVEKVKKLLTLANHAGTNENEAALAMEKVQEILASYNLTLSQVESAPSNGGPKKPEEQRIRGESDKSAMYEYQRNLMNSLAKTHFCVYFVGRKYVKALHSDKLVTKKQHILIGREANVVTVRLMFDYLNSTIDFLVNNLYPPPSNLSKSAVSWREGCSARLCDRIYEKKEEADRRQREEAERQSNQQNGMALVLLSSIRQNENDLNWDFIYGVSPGTTALKRAKSKNEIHKYVPPDPKLSPEDQKKQDKRYEKMRDKWRREEERKWSKKDLNAYWKGHDKGGEIGLDDQVKNPQEKKQIV
jgi:hypothetical protein